MKKIIILNEIITAIVKVSIIGIVTLVYNIHINQVKVLESFENMKENIIKIEKTLDVNEKNDQKTHAEYAFFKKCIIKEHKDCI